MTVNRASIILSLTAIVTGLAGLMIVVNSTSEPKLICIDVLKQKAETLEKKAVESNPDGGLFLISEGKQPRQVNFTGYVGPKTVEVMRVQMVESGLLNIRVETQGTCEAENGLIYTLVTGTYTIPEQKPDPI